MSICSVLVILRRHSEYAVAGLLSVVVIQALGYGLIFDLNFFLRNLSVMGGLLMVLGDSFVKKTRMFAGLPSIDEKDKKMYIQLGGRVLLIFLFIGFVFAGDWSFWQDPGQYDRLHGVCDGGCRLQSQAKRHHPGVTAKRVQCFRQQLLDGQYTPPFSQHC